MHQYAAQASHQKALARGLLRFHQLHLARCACHSACLVDKDIVPARACDWSLYPRSQASHCMLPHDSPHRAPPPKGCSHRYGLLALRVLSQNSTHILYASALSCRRSGFQNKASIIAIGAFCIIAGCTLQRRYYAHNATAVRHCAPAEEHAVPPGRAWHRGGGVRGEV